MFTNYLVTFIWDYIFSYLFEFWPLKNISIIRKNEDILDNI